METIQIQATAHFVLLLYAATGIVVKHISLDSNLHRNYKFELVVNKPQYVNPMVQLPSKASIIITSLLAFIRLNDGMLD